jgi:uncharacterized protein YdeI (YjbR/CyaY-like superfamily)
MYKRGAASSVAQGRHDPAAAAFFATPTGEHRYAILCRIRAVKWAATRARAIGQFLVMLARGGTLHRACRNGPFRR